VSLTWPRLTFIGGTWGTQSLSGVRMLTDLISDDNTRGRGVFLWGHARPPSKSGRAYSAPQHLDSYLRPYCLTYGDRIRQGNTTWRAAYFYTDTLRPVPMDRAQALSQWTGRSVPKFLGPPTYTPRYDTEQSNFACDQTGSEENFNRVNHAPACPGTSFLGLR